MTVEQIIGTLVVLAIATVGAHRLIARFCLLLEQNNDPRPGYLPTGPYDQDRDQ